MDSYTHDRARCESDPPQNYIFPDTDIIMHADEDGSRAEEGNPED